MIIRNFVSHQIERTPDKRYRCTICGRTWSSHPASECPNVPYKGGPSKTHMTRHQLAVAGYALSPNQKPSGYYIVHNNDVIYLWSKRGATKLKEKWDSWAISKAGLKRRLWTDSAIAKYLGVPDDWAKNPHYSKAADMHLYCVARVEAAEALPEFQEWMKKRRVARAD